MSHETQSATVSRRPILARRHGQGGHIFVKLKILPPGQRNIKQQKYSTQKQDTAAVLEVLRDVPLDDHHALLRVASDPTSGIVPLACPDGLNLFAYTACLRGSPSPGVVVRYFSVDVELLISKCTPSIWCYGSVALHLLASGLLLWTSWWLRDELLPPRAAGVVAPVCWCP